jgi:phospholipase/carboxylesterase
MSADLQRPATGPAELLFVLLHGSGATPAQMQPLADALRAQYPQAALALLQAPERLPSEAVHGYRWCDDAEANTALPLAVPALVADVRRLTAELQLDWPRVALAGFSQGGTLALQAVQQEPRLAGRVLALGAAPLARPQTAPEGVCLHLLHGLLDEQVPFRHVVDAAQTWVDLGADVTADVLPGVGHTLDACLIERAMEQLRTFIPSRLWREAVSQAAEMDAADRGAMQRPH